MSVKRKILKPIYPNCGLEMEYRRCLQKLIEDMHCSFLYWISATFKANEPEIAQDALPAVVLKNSINRLSRRWQKRFNKAAPKLARYYSRAISKRTDGALKSILQESGFAVNFKMTRAQRDVLHATVQANVALIKSIPQQYLQDVEGAVMRSVQHGRDLKFVTQAIMKSRAVTKKRAVIIARDQTNKATSALVEARWKEVGIGKAIWRHSGAGKHPRPTHVAMHGKSYDLNKGMYDSKARAWVRPGELINCRCVGQPVIEGFS